MSLTLYLHPLASFCHKVLIGLYENRTPFTPQTVDLGDPESAAAHLARWPVGKSPVLHDPDRGRTVPETTIILEYLQCHYPGPLPLFPPDPEAALEARLWDRFFDTYVSAPMQRIVTARLRGETETDPGVIEARRTLETAYDMIERQLKDRQWAAGADFTVADCAAAPALFFSEFVHPAGTARTALSAYRERLLERPSVARTIEEARPFFSMFPYYDAMPGHYRS